MYWKRKFPIAGRDPERAVLGPMQFDALINNPGTKSKSRLMKRSRETVLIPKRRGLSHGKDGATFRTRITDMGCN